jgi:hypothetical protein
LIEMWWIVSGVLTVEESFVDPEPVR